MMNCKEVVRVISSEDRVNWRTRLEIRFHLFICRHCRKYAKQLDYLRSSLKKAFKTDQSGKKSAEVANLEDKILNSIKK